MKGTTVKGLYREVYGKYDGTLLNDDQQIRLTTDRYFEKYVLWTDDGIYELWAGGFRKKEDIDIHDFEIAEAFDNMNRLKISDIKVVEDRSLTIRFESGQYFEVGLCNTFNAYKHPERYLKFSKTTAPV